MNILDATIADGIATVTFEVTDDEGIPLDRSGLYTEGSVETHFVLAWLGETIDGEPLQYTSYVTNDDGQADDDEGGVYSEVGVGDGVYEYELAADVSGADLDLTHTVAAWATREVEGALYVANAVYDFLPSGGEPTVTREVVQTESCNACHDRLEAHGGSRRDVALCITCHNPQSVDPDTGNTVDFKVMIHKIHRGDELPSVEAGTPYEIIGYRGAVHDYSTVAFPQPIERCESCHTGAQGDLWKTRPTRAACTSCHDLTSFDEEVPVGMEAHPGGWFDDDDNCDVCHREEGGIAGLVDVHTTLAFSRDPTEVVLTILDVTETAPGQVPHVSFDVDVDGAARDIIASPLTSLRLTVAGPTTDYATYWQHTIQGNGATGTLVADGDHFRYTLPAAMPASAAGSYAFGLEGYLQPAGEARASAVNPVFYAAVTDAEVVPRRDVVERERCNTCHYSLGAHGGQRTNPMYCVMCHNSTNTNDERIARFESSEVDVHSVELKSMVHSIHRGEDLLAEYVLGGFPAPSAANPAGTPIDFGEVRYPGDLRNCSTCHLEDSWTLPLPAERSSRRTEVLLCMDDPAADADSYCSVRTQVSESLLPPESAACTSCHDGDDTRAHAEVMTADDGAESCGTCHGPGSEFDVDLMHAREP
jgi:OmcA/MtrC family decaheme c-type cytochrome